MPVLAELDPQLSWYVARSAGLVGWAVVTASIVWGLMLSTRLIRRRGIPAWLLDLHRFLGMLSVVFVAIHVFGIWADTYVAFGWRELLVPMASSWRPGPVAWGIVAMYALLAIEVTSLLMRRIPKRAWRAIHQSSFLLFVASSIHGFQAGSDRDALVVEWLALTGGTIVMFLVVFRLLAPRQERVRLRPARS
jgi:DMSO/TMAO reductase YedYZ heme-binding membrane subunit